MFADGWAVRGQFESLEDRTLMTTAIASSEATAIISGLQALDTFGTKLTHTGPLAAPLPLVGGSLGQIVDAGQALTQGLETVAQSYLTQSTPGFLPTLEGLLAALNPSSPIHKSIDGVDVALTPSVTGNIDPSNPNMLDFQVTFDATATVSENINLGADASNIGLSLATPTPASVSADLHAAFDFTADNTGAFTLTPTTAQPITLDANVTTPAALSLSIPNPSSPGSNATITANVASFQFNPSVAVTLTSSTGGSTLTMADLLAAAPGNLASVTPGGQLEAQLNVSGSLPGSFGNLGTATIGIEDDNVFADATLNFSLSVALGSSLQSQINNALTNLSSFGNQVAQSPAFSTTLPVINKSLDTLLEASGSSSAGVGNFFQLQSAVQSLFNAGGSISVNQVIDAAEERGIRADHGRIGDPLGGAVRDLWRFRPGD